MARPPSVVHLVPPPETVKTVGDGFTVIVKVIGLPVQVIPPFVIDGVTVMVAITGVVLVFIAVNAAMLPVPIAARPILGVLFVQLKITPCGVPENITATDGKPLQTD